MVLRITKPATRRIGAALAVLWVLGAGTLVSGCSWLHFGSSSDDDEIYDYRKVKDRNRGPLDVPPDLSPVSKDDRGAQKSPNTASAMAATVAAPKPDAQAAAVASQMVAPTAPGVHWMHEGTQRWLAVDGSPEIAYATAKDLITGLGYDLAVDEPRLGVLETTWTEQRAKVNEDALRNALHRVFGAFDSTGERFKYRVRIERTPANTAEITVTARAMQEEFNTPMHDTTVWHPVAASPELEAEMLQRIAQRFQPLQGMAVAVAVAPGTEAPPASAAAPAASAPPAEAETPSRVHQVVSDGIPSLQVEASLERAWRQVAVVLDRGGFTVEERNRDKHLFAVRYLDPEYEQREREKLSWWTRVFSSDTKVPAQQFQIHLAANGPTTIIAVNDKDGRPSNDPSAKRILDQIAEQMR